MKKFVKKLLAVMLVVMLILSVAPLSEFANLNSTGMFGFKAEAASYPTISALKIPRIKQISGDSACYLCSFTSVEAYHRGSYGGTNFKYGTDYSQSEQLYKDIKTANGGKVGWSSTIHNKYGYTKDNSPTLAEIYKQLSSGKPVIVYGTSSTYGTHASVIIGYNGSVSSLEQSGFTVMEINASYWKNSQSLFDSYANNPQTYSTSGGNCYVTLSSWLSKASRSMNFICYRTATPSYILNYNYNGANGGEASLDSSTYTITSTVPVKNGYTFLGWSLSSTATTASYVAGDKITLSADTTLYAVWRANVLKVYFNANGGSISSDEYKLNSNIIFSKSNSTEYYQKWTYNKAKDIGLKNASTFGIYKEGYTFSGWGTEPSGGTVFNPDDIELTPTDICSNIKNGDCEITLYAIWEPNKINVYYHANGGEISSDNYKIISGLIYNTSDSSKVCQTWVYNAPHSHGLKNIKTFGLSKPGYTFIGWGTSTSGETILDQNNHDLLPTDITANIKKGDCEITLYAIWQKNAPTTYTLSYNANGGSGAPASQSGATNYTVSNTQPTRSGYTFLGWSKSSSATAASFKAGDNITLTANTTLYAVWLKNTVVPTPVELPEIKINNTTTAINFGDTLVLTLEKIEIPEGYAVAWFVDGTGISTSVSENGLECRVTSIANGNPTIYAKLTDESGEVIINDNGEAIFDEITIISKAGFFQKLISFFKNLFGINRLIY